MAKFIIRWLPFFVLLGIFALFENYRVANRFYPVFLIFMIVAGYLLVLLYKFVIKTGSSPESDDHASKKSAES
jgi:hypothetical protein